MLRGRCRHAAPYTGAVQRCAAAGRSAAAGAVRRRIAVRRADGVQRYPVYAHQPPCAGAGGGAGHWRAVVSAGVADRRGRAGEILEVDIPGGHRLHPAAGHAAGHRRRHGQPRVAGFSLPSGEGAAGGDREDHLHSGAGQAAGVAEGEPESEIRDLCGDAGGTLRRDLRAVLQDIRRHGQRAGVSVHLRLHVLCGGRGAALVSDRRRRGGTAVLRHVGSEPAGHLYEEAVHRPVRPQL